MTDLEFLYILFVAFYLWECTCWVRRGGLAFVRGWGKSSRIASVVGNPRGGLTLAHPLPPLGTLAVATQMPFSLSSEGALAYVAASVNPAGRPIQTGRFLRWSEIKAIQARGKSVHVNGELFVFAQSTMHARWLAAALRELQTLAPTSRAAAIARLLARSFDTKALQQRWTEVESRSRPLLRWLANGLFAFVFLIAPALVWRLGIEMTWPWLLGGVLLLTGTIAFLFRRAHRGLYPEAGDERFSQFLMVMLFAPAAMRAHDLLSRPALEMFHPMAVAAVLASPAEFRALARRVLLDLRHPALPLATEGQPHLAAIEESGRTATLAAVEALVRKAGDDPAELTRPPTPLDATCRAFCPRCHAQFTSTNLHCSDCGGLAAQPFAGNGL
jgi:hypothetical protein